MSLIALLRFCAVTPFCFKDIGRRSACQRKRQQHVFDCNELVAGFLGQLLRLIEQTGGFRSEIDLPGPAAFDFRQFRKLAFDALIDRSRRAARRFDQVRCQPILVVEQRLEHVQRRDLLVAIAQRQALRRLDQGLKAIRILFDLHGSAPGVTMTR